MAARTSTRTSARTSRRTAQRQLHDPELPPLPIVLRESALPRPGDTVAGYRLVRKIADGTRAEVYLGVAHGNDAEAGAAVAIKLYRSHREKVDADAEIVALARLDDPHLLHLVDVGTGHDGLPAAVLERVSRASLTSLLVDRSRFSDGEAVTILAPLIGAVDTMHRAGVAHGSIGVPRVLFRANGAPVLAGFGHSQVIDGALTMAALGHNPSVLADRRALALVAQTVIQRVPGNSFAEVSDWLDGPVDRDAWSEVLQGLVFDAARGEPLAFSDQAITPAVLASVGASMPVPGRIPGCASLAAAPVERSRTRLPRSAAEAQSAALTAARSVAQSLVSAKLRGVRRPVWIVAAAVAVVLVAGGVLIPSTESARQTAPNDSSTGGSGLGSPPSPANAASTAIGADSTGDVAITGDDVIAATSALLVARERCFSELSVLCLDRVDQIGSAAQQRDTELVRAVQDGRELPEAAVVDAGTVTVVEELGDSVLVDLGGESKPASLLVMRGEAGWRIRDYLEE